MTLCKLRLDFVCSEKKKNGGLLTFSHLRLLPRNSSPLPPQIPSPAPVKPLDEENSQVISLLKSLLYIQSHSKSASSGRTTFEADDLLLRVKVREILLGKFVGWGMKFLWKEEEVFLGVERRFLGFWWRVGRETRRTAPTARSEGIEFSGFGFLIVGSRVWTRELHDSSVLRGCRSTNLVSRSSDKTSRVALC
ncbi:hypothetical protein LWI29_027338 [Acer saccharum]|uniref:Uncharacterized protein n=1 Tax=Acer saccharum TaxID=4024 RepID=A0AA39VL27_ACESA|nr:hypothetical protein LWI29_027338 [Acer saccharum]